MPGAEHLRDCATLTTMLKAQAAAGKTTAAVCASPAVVFATHGLLKDAATCYPAYAASSDSSMRPGLPDAVLDFLEQTAIQGEGAGLDGGAGGGAVGAS